MNKNLNSILFRYGLLLILGLGNLFIFYLIFTPLTIYPVLGLLDLLYEPNLLKENTIFFEGYYASIIPACIAASAYYLLLILNLSTPMSKNMRIKSVLFLILSFLILNVLRIFGFALLFTKGFELFNIAHLATWYFGSTILVILLWFTNVRLFKINSIPIYTDIKLIIKQMKGKK